MICTDEAQQGRNSCNYCLQLYYCLYSLIPSVILCAYFCWSKLSGSMWVTQSLFPTKRQLVISLFPLCLLSFQWSYVDTIEDTEQVVQCHVIYNLCISPLPFIFSVILCTYHWGHGASCSVACELISPTVNYDLLHCTDEAKRPKQL